MTIRPKFFGCHVSSSGGLENAVVNGERLKVNTIQLHPSPPQRWNTTQHDPQQVQRFIDAREKSGIKRVFFHGIYLINLANPDLEHQHKAQLSLSLYLDLMHAIGGDGVIFHVGSMKDEPDEQKGFTRAAGAINKILDRSKNNARLILEVAAGSGAIVGDRLEELRAIYDQVEQKNRVGFGLDTQHLWASGYRLDSELEQFVAQVREIFTLEKVWAIHLNDSKTECASRKDRHENFGEGLIGKEALSKFMGHSAFQEIPFILETPALKEDESAVVELAKFCS